MPAPAPAHHPKPHILVVDDDPELRVLIGNYLAGQDMRVSLASDGHDLDALLASDAPDLIVLDLMMPGEDGLSIVRRIKGNNRPAIIMLSAIGEDMDRIVGLEQGADDYLPKPCNPRELLARIRAVLRRRERQAGGPAVRLRFGDWTLDLVARTISRVGRAEVSLTDVEFRTLTALLDRPNIILSRDNLLDAARGENVEIFDRAIDVTVSRLRRKLGEDDPIRTIRSGGYMMTLTAEPA
ncbi:response regulator [Polymorphobacter sp.]|uniref:response regulator n=1 Tax=Polymorphobacter sp. TaxID=1909290 RepID=UPI003F6ED4D8